MVVVVAVISVDRAVICLSADKRKNSRLLVIVTQTMKLLLWPKHVEKTKIVPSPSQAIVRNERGLLRVWEILRTMVWLGHAILRPADIKPNDYDSAYSEEATLAAALLRLRQKTFG